MEDNKDNVSEEIHKKPGANSGNDAANERFDYEKLIDPGNEHDHDSHLEEDLEKKIKEDANSDRHGTGTIGGKPK